jgi:hypothetical protein
MKERLNKSTPKTKKRKGPPFRPANLGQPHMTFPKVPPNKKKRTNHLEPGISQKEKANRKKKQTPKISYQYPILLQPPSKASPPTNFPIFTSSTSSNTLELRISHILVAVFPI